MTKSLKDLLEIDNNASVVILTGSGISAESGIPTFRDAGGLWAKYNVEDVATPQAFAKNPALVHEFYNLRRAQVQESNIRPNAAHEALAAFEKKWQGNVLLITQNVDDLHERSGSENVLHMHGELLKIRCSHCSEVSGWTDALSVQSLCKACNKDKGLRPHIVWFGEMPFYMNEIADALADCDLFISIGTSGSVYPAAGFVHDVLYHGGKTMEINLEPSANARDFDKGFYGRASVKVPECIETLLA